MSFASENRSLLLSYSSGNPLKLCQLVHLVTLLGLNLDVLLMKVLLFFSLSLWQWLSLPSAPAAHSASRGKLFTNDCTIIYLCRAHIDRM